MVYACVDGTKAGMNAENGAKQAVNKATGATMSVEEARQILGVDPNATPEQVMQVLYIILKRGIKHQGWRLSRINRKS